MKRATETTGDTLVGDLLNLGPVSTAWLVEIGVRTAGDLNRLGAVVAYRMVKARHPEASLNLLYALHGAVTGTRWNTLSATTKAKLKRDADTL
jgi:DNA transformation protein and related proteins